MKFDTKKFEESILENARLQLEDRIKKMRCKIHGSPRSVKLVKRGTKWDVQGLCCDDFLQEVHNSLK